MTDLHEAPQAQSRPCPLLPGRRGRGARGEPGPWCPTGRLAQEARMTAS